MKQAVVDPRLRWVSHVGYAARGSLFLLIGILALVAVWDSYHQPVGATGALNVLGRSLGTPLLALFMPGLICFSAWRILQAYWDVDGLGDKPAALAKRAVFALNGIFYSILALWSLWIEFGSSAPKEEEEAVVRDWTSWMLQLPFGSWVLAVVGLTIVGTGLGVAVRALMAPLDKRLVVNRKTKNWLEPMTRYALLARAVIFGLVGGSLVLAASKFDIRAAKGLGGMLSGMRDQSYGGAWLGMLAVGLIGYGSYEFAQAFWHRRRSR